MVVVVDHVDHMQALHANEVGGGGDSVVRLLTYLPSGREGEVGKNVLMSCRVSQSKRKRSRSDGDVTAVY